MKMFAGKQLAYWLGLLLLIASPSALARLTASVDRADVAIGETLRLVLTADAGERPDEVDLTALDRDFEILKRSSATSARLVNGDQTVTRTLELELAPRREGLVTIPSFTAGGRSSTPIAVKVSPAPKIDAGDALVLFDAELDRTDVYVQAQLLLTLTLQQAINLDQREVTPLELPDADVEMLEQRTYQRQINGRLWQVIELRYAIFPQESGSLTIPALTFSGREILPGRSLLGARLGRRMVIDTDPMTINVKPVPEEFPGAVWLPARSLTITENWSKAPGALALGDSSTRTLEIAAEGLQGSQLPPLESLDAQQTISGLRFYPGQETIDQVETAAGLSGLRTQSEALVPSQPGAWTLPERVLPWWNTDTDQLEYARVPARELSVAAAALPSLDPAIDATTAAVDRGPAVVPAWLYVLAGSGWLISLLLAWLLWRRRPSKAAKTSDIEPENERRALVALRLACQQNNPAEARKALLQWARYFFDRPDLTLDGLTHRVSAELATEIEILNRSLYAGASDSWDGQKLFSATRAQPRVSAMADTPISQSLYPSTLQQA